MLMILCKKIETDNVFEDLCKDKELFDFSNIQDSKYYSNSNNLVLGKMKDGTSGMSIKGSVGLKSKMDTIMHLKKEKTVIKMLLIMNYDN